MTSLTQYNETQFTSTATYQFATDHNFTGETSSGVAIVGTGKGGKFTKKDVIRCPNCKAAHNAVLKAKRDEKKKNSGTTSVRETLLPFASPAAKALAEKSLPGHDWNSEQGSGKLVNDKATLTKDDVERFLKTQDGFAKDVPTFNAAALELINEQNDYTEDQIAYWCEKKNYKTLVTSKYGKNEVAKAINAINDFKENLLLFPDYINKN